MPFGSWHPTSLLSTAWWVLWMCSGFGQCGRFSTNMTWHYPQGHYNTSGCLTTLLNSSALLHFNLWTFLADWNYCDLYRCHWLWLCGSKEWCRWCWLMKRSTMKARTTVIVSLVVISCPIGIKLFSKWTPIHRVSYPRQKLYCHHWHYFILDWHNGQQLTIIISGNITVVGVIIMWLPIAGTGIISLVAAAWGHKVATKQQLKTQTPALLAL